MNFNDEIFRPNVAELFNEEASSVNNKDITSTRNGFYLDYETFGPLKTFILDENITDIDFDGENIWLSDINNKHWKEENIEGFSPTFIDVLAHQIADKESVDFNRKHPWLEVEDEEKGLRISVLHKDIVRTGTSMCIRKTPITQRIQEDELLTNGYCSRAVLNLLINCIKAHMNIIICGEPRAGKTELAKFISKYIPDSEKVITIEDVLEWHYKYLNPTAEVNEIKVNDDFTYSDAIVKSLKQNPRWIMIAETRGEEVKDLITSFTTGVHGITTLHTESITKIPDRIVNMSNDINNQTRILNNVYEFVNVGILVSIKTMPDGSKRRVIDEVGFFTRENDENKCSVVVQNGELFPGRISNTTIHKFKDAYIDNIFECDLVDKELARLGYNDDSDCLSMDSMPTISQLKSGKDI